MTTKRHNKIASAVLQVPDMSFQDRIFALRGEKVILDSDLAEIYGVEVRTLNQQVKRNMDRFPEDFSFLLTKVEGEAIAAL